MLSPRLGTYEFFTAPGPAILSVIIAARFRLARPAGDLAQYLAADSPDERKMNGHAGRRFIRTDS